MGIGIQQALETVQEQLASGESLEGGSITLILAIAQQLLQVGLACFCPSSSACSSVH